MPVSPLNILPLLVISQVVSAQSFEVSYDEPDYDRWMYPFNGVPGSRGLASTFTSYGSGYDFLDERDGQILLGFHTFNEIPMEMGSTSYRILSAKLTLMVETDGIIYDSTPDDWETYLLEGGPEDGDPGRAAVVSGASFRNGYDGWSFGETGEFPGGAGVGERNAYPIEFLDDGTTREISNNITGMFNPGLFGVGLTNDVEPGEAMPTMTTLNFELDVDDRDIQCYLRTALDDGLLSLVVTSMHPAEQPGLRGTLHADWFMKENSLVFIGLADAAGLELNVELVEPSGVEADINADGIVGVMDLLAVLNDWGRCPCCPSDLDGNGATDVMDLLAVIAAWGN